MESNEIRYRFGKEAGAWHGGNTNLSRQPMTKRDITGVTKIFNIHQHIIGALWFDKPQARLAEITSEQFAPAHVIVRELLIIFRRETQRSNRCLLQWMGSPHRQEVVHLSGLPRHPPSPPPPPPPPTPPPPRP